MSDNIEIFRQEISEKNHNLELEMQGIVCSQVNYSKLRIIAIFQYEKQQRRYVIDSKEIDIDEAGKFKIQTQISLVDIFYHFELGKTNNTEVSFEYCNAEGDWKKFSNKIYIPAKYFTKRRKKENKGTQILHAVTFGICSLTLPIWVVDGYLAVRGLKKSEYIDQEQSLKKAVFSHANGLVKKWTSYSYSPREWKTKYFAKQYKKACKKQKETKGILLLSERIIDQGGNLDLIRRGLIASKADWVEFIDTRPIHKLPLKKIKEAAKLTAQSKVVVLEDFYPQLHALDIRKETEIVQLWHACGAFKMFGLSEIGKVNHLKQNTQNHRNYSKAMVSGTKMIPFYSEAFGIPESNVYALGVPRTDVFFDMEYQKNIKTVLCQKYPMLKNKKVILFAPTFRGSGNKTAFYPIERFNVNQFLARMSEDTILILKNHPFVKNTFVIEEKYQNRVLDLTGKENINDVLFLTNLLITDYSSSVFEASLLKIPMLFYVFDLEEYIESRDFYFDFETFIPGKKVEQFEELIEESRKVLEEHKIQEKKNEAFCKYFLDALDGNSTERVLNLILELSQKNV